MTMTDRLFLTALLLGSPVVVLAQPTTATDVTRAEIQAVFDTIGRSVDKQIKIVDIGQKANVAVGILHRGAMSTEGATVSGIVHHDVTEVYYILSGGGTLVTGGSVEITRQWDPASGVVQDLVGPSASANTADGRSREVGEGDIVVIPAGVFHAFSHIDDHVSYLSIRVDPDQVLPAGYVNPVLE